MERWSDIVGFIGAMALAVALSHGSAAWAQGEARTQAGGGVTIRATWLATGPGEPLRFHVVLDTHSVNLDAYRVETLAVVRTDTGVERPARAWVTPQGSGHHRSGVLEFARAGDDGADMLTGARTLDLVLTSIAGVRERLFRWPVPATP